MEAFIARWQLRLAAVWRVVVVPLGGLRTLIMLALAAWLLSVDPKATRALGYGMGLAVAALTFLSWYRKTAHPYIDIAKLVEKAAESPTGASIVVAAFFAFLASVLAFVLLVVIR